MSNIGRLEVSKNASYTVRGEDERETLFAGAEGGDRDGCHGFARHGDAGILGGTIIEEPVDLIEVRGH